MKTIFWTYKHLTGEGFKNHDSYGKYGAIAIHNNDKLSYCFTVTDEGELFSIFNDIKSLTFDIEQLRKPKYYEALGTSYELRYVDCDSIEWKEAISKFFEFCSKIETFLLYISLPWYIKLYYKIKGYLFK